MGRRPKRAAPRPRAMTEPARQRSVLLAEKGFTRTQVWREARLGGFTGTRVTAYKVLAGQHRNVHVEAAFCRLTGAEPHKAFPTDELRGRELLRWQREQRGAA